MNKKVSLDNLTRGIFRENPTLVMLLGMCPTLGVSTSAENGFGMGMATMFVLVLSNMAISATAPYIPDKVRIPGFIVVIATFVTLTELLLKAFLPALNDSLGLYIPLIVVNCIIMGRAEAYACKNGVLLSMFDGIGMGLGFTMALTMIGAIRELLGTGAIFGFTILSESFYEPITIFILAPGAFLVLSMLVAAQNKINLINEKKAKEAAKAAAKAE